MTHPTDTNTQHQPPALDTAKRIALRRVSARWAFFSFAVLGLLGVTLWLRYTAPTPVPAASAPEPRRSSLAVLPVVNARRGRRRYNEARPHSSLNYHAPPDIGTSRAPASSGPSPAHGPEAPLAVA